MSGSITTRRRRGLLALFAVVVGVTVVAGVGSPASADPQEPPGRDKEAVAPGAPEEPVPAGFAGWDQLWAEQARLNRAADTVADAGEREAGYTGMSVDPQRHEVLLYWHGGVPQSVESALASARTTASVRVLPAAHSRAQLDAEVERWLASGQVSGGAPNEDGSGVGLTVEPGGRASDLVRPIGAVAPFTVSDTGAPVPAWDRSNDTPAYWGGGRLAVNAGGGTCTAGWPVRDRNGYPAMLTAAHCAALGASIYDGGGFNNSGDYLGYVNERHTIRDAMLVTAAKALAPRVFLGTPTTTNSLPVTGSQKVYKDNWVCTNGAKTGLHCNIKVTETSYSSTMKNGQQIKHMVVAKHQAGGCALDRGDSGGPVLAYGSTATAQGTITAGNGPENIYCGYGEYGFHTVVFPRITDVLLQFNATLMT